MRGRRLRGAERVFDLGLRWPWRNRWSLWRGQGRLALAFRIGHGRDFSQIGSSLVNLAGLRPVLHLQHVVLDTIT